MPSPRSRTPAPATSATLLLRKRAVLLSSTARKFLEHPNWVRGGTLIAGANESLTWCGARCITQPTVASFGMVRLNCWEARDSTVSTACQASLLGMPKCPISSPCAFCDGGGSSELHHCAASALPSSRIPLIIAAMTNRRHSGLRNGKGYQISGMTHCSE